MIKNPDIKISDNRFPKFCSLYRAARYIAFHERPVNDEVARITYGSRNFSTEKKSSQKYNFFLACQSLRLELLLGNLEAEACVVYHELELSTEQNVVIPKEFFSNKSIRIDWNTSSFHMDTIDGETRFYEGVVINTLLLLDRYSLTRGCELKEGSSKAGRPEKYDWRKTVNPVVLEYFLKLTHLDDSEEYHTKAVLDLLVEENIPEEEIPSHNQLKNEYMKPLLKRLKSSGAFS